MCFTRIYGFIFCDPKVINSSLETKVEGQNFALLYNTTYNQFAIRIADSFTYNDINYMALQAIITSRGKVGVQGLRENGTNWETISDKNSWTLLNYAVGTSGATVLSIPISDSIKDNIHELFVRVKMSTANNAKIHYKYIGYIIAEDFISHTDASHNYLFGMDNNSSNNSSRNNCIIQIPTNFNAILLTECYLNGTSMLGSSYLEFRVWYK